MVNMGETVLVSTFYSFEPLVAAVHNHSPKKIILLVADDTAKNENVKANIAKAREIYGKVAEIEVKLVKGADLLSIAQSLVDLLEKENKSVVNVSGGWKLLAQGVLYGCYARPELVERIVCNDLSKENTLVELPKLGYGLTTAKRELLEEIGKRNGKTIAEIAEKLEKTRGMLYQHLKELKEMGYVDDEFRITLAGRLALL